MQRHGNRIIGTAAAALCGVMLVGQAVQAPAAAESAPAMISNPPIPATDWFATVETMSYALADPSWYAPVSGSPSAPPTNVGYAPGATAPYVPPTLTWFTPMIDLPPTTVADDPNCVQIDDKTVAQLGLTGCPVQPGDVGADTTAGTFVADSTELFKDTGSEPEEEPNVLTDDEQAEVEAEASAVDLADSLLCRIATADPVANTQDQLVARAVAGDAYSFCALQRAPKKTSFLGSFRNGKFFFKFRNFHSGYYRVYVTCYYYPRVATKVYCPLSGKCIGNTYTKGTRLEKHTWKYWIRGAEGKTYETSALNQSKIADFYEGQGDVKWSVTVRKTDKDGKEEDDASASTTKGKDNSGIVTLDEEASSTDQGSIY